MECTFTVEGRGEGGLVAPQQSARRILSPFTYLLYFILYNLYFLPLSLPAATNDLTTLLQQGLFDEEANRDLPAAIADYQSLATQFDRDRQVAATAVYRLGECYRKLGQTNEATAQYQRLLRDFADQKDLVTLSQQNLTGLGVATPPNRSFNERLQTIVKGAAGAGLAAESQPTQLDLLRQEIKTMENELANDQQLARSGILPANETLPVEEKLLELKRQLATLEAGEPMATAGGTAESADLLAAQLAGLEQLKNDPEKRALAALAMYPDDDLKNMLLLLSALKAQAATALTNTNNEWYMVAHAYDYGSGAMKNLNDGEHRVSPDPKYAQEQVQKQLGFISQRVDFIISLQQARLSVLQSVAGATAGKPAGSGSAAPTDEEAREIVRIQQMIQNSPDLINVPGGDKGHTPLATAAINGWLKVAAYLLDHGADVNAGKAACEAALYHAARAGNRAMVEFLLSRGADVNADCPLSVASEKGFQAVVDVLLANKADVNQPACDNTSHNTPLSLAVIFNHANIAQKLLAAGANPNLENNDGRTPLSYAAESGSLEIMKLLLDAKADPNGGRLNAPLFSAINNRNPAATELLLQQGAKPNLKGQISWRVDINNNAYGDNFQRASVTPLWLAVYLKHPPLVQLLLKYQADPNDAQTDGRAVLFNALSETNILTALLEAGAKGDPTDRTRTEQWTPLEAAASGNSVTAVDILLKHGANPNASDQEGLTPLHWAANRMADPAIFELLLAHQADPNVRDHYGQTPLDRIKPYYNPGSNSDRSTLAGQLAALLRQHGALDQLPDWDRITASRTSANYSAPVFHKGANDGNQFTLLELIAVQCRLLNGSPGEIDSGYDKDAFFSSFHPVPYPDLTHLRIHRPAADYKKTPDLMVNLAPALQSGDASNDLPLQWGDVVEIPEADHPLNEKWPGFSDPELANLKKCLTRHVTVIVNGQTNLLTLAPGITFKDPFGEIIPAPYAANRPEVPNGAAQGRTEISTTPFWLTPVLMQSKLVLASSDLAHVHVTRRDPQTGKSAEWTFDCSHASASSQPPGGFGGGGLPRPMAPPRPIGPGGRPVAPSVSAAADAPDLWLRDGDVITVPERP